MLSPCLSPAIEYGLQKTGDFVCLVPSWTSRSQQSKKVKVKSLSRVRLFATPWTVAYQAPPFMGFSRQEYWSGLPFPSLGDLPYPGFEPSEPPGKSHFNLNFKYFSHFNFIFKNYSKSSLFTFLPLSNFLSSPGIYKIGIITPVYTERNQ